MPNEQTHTIIIGAGPAGASAAIYLARYCHAVTIFDAPSEVHGRTSMAPDIHNFLTYSEPVKGPAFMEKINAHLAKHPIERIEEKVVKVTRNDNIYTVTTNKGTVRRAGFVVLAVGLSDNMPEIDGLDPYYDNAIYHCLTCDWYERRDKKIAVIGNTDRAISTAAMIHDLHVPPKLVVIPANNKPQFSRETRALAKLKNIEVFDSPLMKLIGQDGFLHAVRLKDGAKVDVEVLFTKLGHKRFDQFLDEGGITVEREPNEGFIKIDWRTFETSMQNLFAVGPCNEGPDQAIISAGQGAMAALEIHKRIVDLSESHK